VASEPWVSNDPVWWLAPNRPGRAIGGRGTHRRGGQASRSGSKDCFTGVNRAARARRADELPARTQQLTP
jgi:hypothetical protein